MNSNLNESAQQYKQMNADSTNVVKTNFMKSDEIT